MPSMWLTLNQSDLLVIWTVALRTSTCCEPRVHDSYSITIIAVGRVTSYSTCGESRTCWSQPLGLPGFSSNVKQSSSCRYGSRTTACRQTLPHWVWVVQFPASQLLQVQYKASIVLMCFIFSTHRRFCLLQNLNVTHSSSSTVHQTWGKAPHTVCVDYMCLVKASC